MWPSHTRLAIVALLVHSSLAKFGALELPIARRSGPQLLSRRASGSSTASLLNNVSAAAYVTTVKVGTPPQTLTLQLDTGSSDTWVPSVDASVCASDGCFYGSFNADNSQTFKDALKDGFSISYGDNTSAKGDYFTDVITIGDADLQQLVMGLGLDTDIQFGLVGVGYPSNEAIDHTAPQDEYLNLPFQLVNEEIIASPAYSLWLNDLDSSTGSILFGGVDTDKYHGDLTRLSLYPSTAGTNVSEFIVAMTSVTASSSSGTDSLGSKVFPAAILLDSGTTFTSLPIDLTNEMYKVVGAETDSQGNPLVPCSMINSEGTFSFGFGGPSGVAINVSMSELVMPGALAQYKSGDHKGEDACLFGIFAATSDDEPLILGDIFLRSAYVVYDLANNEVAMAQTDFNATSVNVVTFSSSGAVIPSSTPAPSQDAVVQGVTTTTATAFAAASGFVVSAKNGAGRVRGAENVVFAVVGNLLVGLGGLFFL